MLVREEVLDALRNAEIAFEIGDVLYFSIIDTCVFVDQVVNFLEEALIACKVALFSFMLDKSVIVYDLLKLTGLLSRQSAQQKIEFVVSNEGRGLILLLLVPLLHSKCRIAYKIYRCFICSLSTQSLFLYLSD